MDNLISRIWCDASAITNLLVAVVAYWVYARNRRNQISDAASLVELDIRLMSEQVAVLYETLIGKSIPKTDFALINMGSRISDTWNGNKSLLVSKLTSDDIAAINSFIQRYSRLRDLYEGAVKTYEANIASKADELQKRLCESFFNNYADLTQAGSFQNSCFSNYYTHSFTFSPDHYLTNSLALLNNHQDFIQTPAFKNLSELAQSKQRWLFFKRR